MSKSKRLVPSFFSGNYTITRSKSGTFDRGRYVPGPKETIQVKGSLQPIGGRDIKMLEEGERIRDHYTFYSDAAISVIDTTTQAEADVVTINGETYRVVSVEEWENQPGFAGRIDLPHFKSILKREPQQ